MNIFHFIYGMSSFPLTNSIICQDGHIAPPTSLGLVLPTEVVTSGLTREYGDVNLLRGHLDLQTSSDWVHLQFLVPKATGMSFST